MFPPQFGDAKRFPNQHKPHPDGFWSQNSHPCSGDNTGPGPASCALSSSSCLVRLYRRIVWAKVVCTAHYRTFLHSTCSSSSTAVGTECTPCSGWANGAAVKGVKFDSQTNARYVFGWFLHPRLAAETPVNEAEHPTLRRKEADPPSSKVSLLWHGPPCVRVGGATPG